MFGTLALYILRLRFLAIPNTVFNFFWKRGLRRFVMCAIALMIFVQTYRKILGDFTESKSQTFQNDVVYVSKISYWAVLGLFLWLQLKKLCWELPEISLLETIRVLCSNAESRSGADCRQLRLKMGFKSCIWDIQYQLLNWILDFL